MVTERRYTLTKPRVATKQECNQYRRDNDLGLAQCFGPALWQSAKGGARWCSECRNKQIAIAQDELRRAKRDIARLDALAPVPGSGS